MHSHQIGLLALILCTIAFVRSDEYSHRYVDGEEILLWVNKVGPYRNPQETYKYYTLPYCRPEKDVESRFEGLGEALQGYELIQSDMKVYYKRDVPESTLCEKTLTAEEVDKFKVAVKNQYWYQLFMDDLPIWGMVGEAVPDAGEEKLYLYTHKKFMGTWNEDRVIEVNLTSENPVPLERGASVTFTYSVTWHKTDIPYSQRFEKYLDENFFEHQIHWFSIFNSFMMVIFLTGLVSMILMRTLRRDYARYAKDDDDADDDPRDIDESGWKQVHGDVFRPPSHLVTFAALVGTGHQLIVLVFSVIIYSFLMGTLYANRGTIVTTFIVCYVFTSFIAGYGGGGFYARNEGKHWIKAMILTATLFPGICFGIAILLDFIAVLYGSLASIPIGTIIAMLAIWGLASAPMTVAGTLVGRNWNGTADNPCRINPVPRQIPEKKWFMHPLVNIVLGGILPFGSIFIEMYFMFTAFWHYKYYYVYGFMLLVYAILIVVSICVTIVSTYFLLNSEDYRWQWVSFLSSGSTAGYVFLYSIYYFFVKTKMSGFFQTCFYFGYTGMFCVGLGILCGSLGYIGTSIFVKRIYQNVKVD